VRDGGWLREEVASVVKVAIEENGPFGIRIGLERRMILIAVKHFNGRNILLDYKGFWRLLVRQQIVVYFLQM
jgi:hypothetical protein